MDNLDIIWLTAFVAVLIVLYFLHFLVTKSLKEKPLGSQTIFDSVVLDNFVLVRMYGTWVCLIDIASRFETVRDLFVANDIPLVIVCSVTNFGFACFCINR